MALKLDLLLYFYKISIENLQLKLYANKYHIIKYQLKVSLFLRFFRKNGTKSIFFFKNIFFHTHYLGGNLFSWILSRCYSASGRTKILSLEHVKIYYYLHKLKIFQVVFQVCTQAWNWQLKMENLQLSGEIDLTYSDLKFKFWTV